MKNSTQDSIEDLNTIIRECETYLFITRDTDLQYDACVKLQDVQRLAGQLKLQAIEANDDNFANLLLGFECVADMLLAELSMWINLKNEKADAAWDDLVRAQSAGIASARAHPGFAHNDAHVKRLEEIEALIFPPQVFVSAGFIVKRQECSICGVEYGECEHVAGRPYMGRFCSIVARDITADHVAIVKHPADKRCRITSFETEDGTRNRMTWKIDPKATQPSIGDDESPGTKAGGGLTCSAIISTTGN